MSSAKRVDFGGRNRANSTNDEYSLEGYDPNYLGPSPAFEQFPPYTHKPKPPSQFLLSKGNYFVFHEATPRDLWFCEFPHCTTTFFPYLMVGMRHHCRACGISVCIHHCSHNLTISSNILTAFEGNLDELSTPIIATSLDGTTLPAVVTLKYVCLLCSANAVTMSAEDKRTKKTNTNTTAEADQLLLKLQAAQAALQANTADVHSLTTSVHSVAAQMQTMRGTIEQLEAQVGKNANKEYRKVQRLKQQLRELNAQNESKLGKNNSHTATSAITTYADNAASNTNNTNTTPDLRTVSLDSTSNENSVIGTSDDYISDSDDESVDSRRVYSAHPHRITTSATSRTSATHVVGAVALGASTSAHASTTDAHLAANTSTTNTVTATATNPDTAKSTNTITNTNMNTTTPLSPLISPIRPIDQLYHDIVNSSLFISTTTATTTTNNTTNNTSTITEATQTTPYGVVKPIESNTNNTNTSSNTRSGRFSPASATASTLYGGAGANNNGAKFRATNTHASITAADNTTAHNTTNTTNNTTITNNANADNSTPTNADTTPTTTPTLTLTLSTSPSPSPYSHNNINTPLTDVTRHTSHTSASAWVDYNDIYDTTHPDNLHEVFDTEYPEIRNISSGDSQDSDSVEYSQLYSKNKSSGVINSGGGIVGVSGDSRGSGGSGVNSIVGSVYESLGVDRGTISHVGSGYMGGMGSSDSAEYNYEPDLLDVYGTRYSSVFNMLDADIESESVSPVNNVSIVGDGGSSGKSGSYSPVARMAMGSSTSPVNRGQMSPLK